VALLYALLALGVGAACCGWRRVALVLTLAGLALGVAAFLYHAQLPPGITL
jgi:hypothetical protein